MHQIKPAILGCCLILLAACGTTRPSHFYLLTPLEKSDTARHDSGPGVIVGPVTLPEYLLRPQIVRRNHANEIGFDEFHRWAEPLHDNLSRVMAENLSLLLGSSRIALYPGYKTAGFPYQVVIDMVRMDAGPARQVTLVARWSLLDRHSKKLLVSNRSTIAVPLGNTSHKALVTAHSNAVAQLSREIAEAIRAAADPPPTVAPSPD